VRGIDVAFHIRDSDRRAKLSAPTTMTVRWLGLQLLLLSMCGCSSGQQVLVAQPHPSFAYWDGERTPPSAGQDQGPKSKVAQEMSNTEDRSAIERKEAKLKKLPEYSKEWMALRRQIDAEDEARIAKILAICRGCETAASKTDRIASSHQ
jgi:hypothetical protein